MRFFNQVVCRFGMPIVIHSDQGREFENKIMQELCILCGSHKTRTTPYHPESDGMVERFNRTLLMMLATVQITFIFIGQTRLDFGKRVCICVTKHSNAFRTFQNWLKNSKRVLHEPKLHILRLHLFAHFDMLSVSVWGFSFIQN